MIVKRPYPSLTSVGLLLRRRSLCHQIEAHKIPRASKIKATASPAVAPSLSPVDACAGGGFPEIQNIARLLITMACLTQKNLLS